MEPKTLESWEDLKEEIKGLHEQFKTLRKADKGYVSELLFRGQRDYKWKLQSTLSRRVAGGEILARDYMTAIFPISKMDFDFMGCPHDLVDDLKLLRFPTVYGEEESKWLRFEGGRSCFQTN